MLIKASLSDSNLNKPSSLGRMFYLIESQAEQTNSLSTFGASWLCSTYYTFIIKFNNNHRLILGTRTFSFPEFIRNQIWIQSYSKIITVRTLIIFKLISNMASIEQLSYHDKISMIRNRYKSTKDLWLYMTERRKFNLLLQNNFMFPSWLLDAFSEEL